MSLEIYNTRHRKKQPFREDRERTVTMYICGPTVYDYSHLGHAKTYVSFDTVRRYLEFKGYKVRFVLNITDVAEEISRKAAELGMKASELAQKFAGEYLRDMDALNIRRADVYPKPSDHIPEIIETIKKLADVGMAYEIDGELYFDISKSLGCGILSGLSEKELLECVNFETKKRSLLDFALWKKPKEFEDSWESPWGKGRPGWHIECYAMASKFLGVPFDIQGGGLDLVFPHHESSHLMACALADVDFASVYMHNGFVTMGAQKMSKSKGHFITMRPLIEKFGSMNLRFYLVKCHYRSNLEYDPGGVVQAGKELSSIYDSIAKLRTRAQEGDQTQSEGLDAKLEDSKKIFFNAMDDDFNTTRAVEALLELAVWSKDAKGSGKQLRAIADALESFLSILGFESNAQVS